MTSSLGQVRKYSCLQSQSPDTNGGISSEFAYQITCSFIPSDS